MIGKMLGAFGYRARTTRDRKGHRWELHLKEIYWIVTEVVFTQVAVIFFFLLMVLSDSFRKPNFFDMKTQLLAVSCNI